MNGAACERHFTLDPTKPTNQTNKQNRNKPNTHTQKNEGTNPQKSNKQERNEQTSKVKIGATKCFKVQGDVVSNVT